MAGTEEIKEAFEAAAAFGKSAVNIAPQRQRAEIELASALNRSGQATADALAHWIEYAGGLSRSTSMTRDAVLQTIALGASLGELSGKQLADATRAAIGWATIMGGTPLEAMQRMMIVMRGGTGAQDAIGRFEQWGVNFGAAETPERRLAAMQPGGEAGFQLAETSASGMAGDLDRLRYHVEDFSAVVGETAFAMSGLHDASEKQVDDAERTEATFLGVLAGIGIQIAASIGRLLAAMGDRLIGGFAGFLGTIESFIPGMGKQSRTNLRRSERLNDAADEHLDAIITGWKSIGAPKVAPAAGVQGKLPKDLGAMRGGTGDAGIVSPIAPAGAMPGGIAYGRIPSAFGGLGGFATNPAERTADILETYLPQIAENTRKEPRAPYQVTQ